MSRRVKRKKIQTKKVRNVVIIALIAICLFVIYKFNFKTKSNIEKTTTVNFKEFGTEANLKENIPLLENENGDSYIVLPEKINGIFVTKYFLDVDENKIKNDNSKTNTVTDKLQETNQVVENTIDDSSKINNSIDNDTTTENKTKIDNTIKEDEIDLKKELPESLFERAISKETTTEIIGEKNKLATEQTTNTIANSENEIKKDDKEDEKEENSNTTTNKDEIISNTVTNTIVTDDNENKNTNTDTNTNTNTNTSNSSTNTTIIENSTDKNEVEDDITSKESKDNEEKNNEVIPENNVNNEKIIDENYITVAPGEKYYISKENLKEGTISIVVEFQTVEVNETRLYNTELIAERAEATINLTCFIPLDYYLDVKEEDKNDVEELKADVETLSNSKTLLAYDITITDGENEYQPQQYGQVAKVIITPTERLESGKLEVLHIVDKEADEETEFQKITPTTRTSDEIEFNTDEFSVYAVILYAAVDGSTVTIDNYDADRYYYKGKNYTDNISGVNSGTYPDSSFAKVIVRYHGNAQSDKLAEISGSKTYVTNVTEADDPEDFSLTNCLSIKEYQVGDFTTTSGYGNTTYTGYVKIIFNINGLDSYALSNLTLSNVSLTLGNGFSLTGGNANTNTYTRNNNTITSITLRNGDYNREYNTITIDVRVTKNSGSSFNPTITGVTASTLEGTRKTATRTTATAYYISKLSKNDDFGYISATERQNLVIYEHCVPVVGGKAKIELIDNPFMDRPVVTRKYYTDTTYQTEINRASLEKKEFLYGFDGWVEADGSFTNVPIEDSDTKVQTLTVTCTAGTTTTVDLYANWEKANVVFAARDARGNNDGSSVENLLGSSDLSTSVEELSTNGLVTAHHASNRELNIVVITAGTVNVDDSNFSTTTARAYTLTSLYKGTDYSDSASINIGRDITLNNDLQLDFLNITGPTNYNYSDNAASNVLVSNYYLIGNCKNLRIGRGMTPKDSAASRSTFSQVDGGFSSGTAKNYRLVIESGKYNKVLCGRATSSSGYTANVQAIIGNDYDRISDDGTNNNNAKLKIYNRFASRTANITVKPKNGNEPLYDMRVKSGEIGLGFFNDHKNNNNNFRFTGIYVGGYASSANDTGDRILTVEGGKIANIVGGLQLQGTYVNTVKTNIYVKGGTIENIVGGAGRTETAGNRIIQITGGKINYSVFGGSNGEYLQSGDNGALKGSTLVYVGGNAEIGLGEGNTSTLYGVTSGSVFGAGIGKTDTNTSGSVYKSHIIVNDSAKIHNSVYGGGNYGVNDYTMPDPDAVAFINETSRFTTDDNYLMSTATNGGNALRASGTNLENEVLSVSTVPSAAANWTFESTGVANQYYIKNTSTGEYLYCNLVPNYTYSEASLEYKSNNNYSQYINNDYYVDSSGNELITSISCRKSFSLVTYTYTWTINGRNSTTTGWTDAIGAKTIYKRNVGTPTMNIMLSDTNKSVFTFSSNSGGYRIYTTSSGTNYYVRFNSNTWSLDNNRNNATTLYFLKYQMLEDTVAAIATIDILDGEIQKDVYGGANNNGAFTNAKDVSGSTLINVKGGTIKGAVYGACNTSGAISGSAYINITGGQIGTSNANDAVFGGGRGNNTNVKQKTEINVTDKDRNVIIKGNIYGGSAFGKVTQDSKISIKDYLSTSNSINFEGKVFGGGKGQSSTAAINNSDVSIVVDGGTYDNVKVFGGANINGTIDGNISVKIGKEYNTRVGEVYGGGEQAAVTNSTDDILVELYSKATVTNAFVGGNNAGVENRVPLAIKAIGATVTNLYGGSNTTGTVTNSKVFCSENANITKVFGGGKGASTVVNTKSNVSIDNSNCNYVYGGSEFGNVKASDVDIENNSICAVVYGGGLNGTIATSGSTGNTVVKINDSTINAAFGGGEGYSATVYGPTKITLQKTNGQETPIITGLDAEEYFNCIYGGGNLGSVQGNTVVEVKGSSIPQKVYGAGNRAAVTGSTTITMENVSDTKSSATEVYGGGNFGNVGGATGVYINGLTNIYGYVYGGGNEGFVTGNTTVTINNSNVQGDVYGGGKLADVNKSTVSVLDHSTAGNVYGGGDQGEIKTNTEVYVDESNILGSNLDSSLGSGKVYGGGRGAAVTASNIPGKVGTNTKVVVRNSSNITGSVFGGGRGNTAIVGTNTELTINSSVIGLDVYGGGDNGAVEQNSTVKLLSSTVGGSAYGGGNGAPAVVKKTTYISVDGSTNITENLFGSGNAANTGIESDNVNNNLSTKPAGRMADSVVDIAGATIGGNVYGGGNSSAVFGDTVVNIGTNAISTYYAGLTGVTAPTLTRGPITITKTIYGGGEQMDPTKEFNYNTVSVAGFININIDGTGYNETDTKLSITGSIFGSGNASRAALEKSILVAAGLISDDVTENIVTLNGNVNIKNYGSVGNIRKGISIQRCTKVVIDSSYMYLAGTTDSTSSRPLEDYTFNQIGNLTLKNGSSIYLRKGANLLQSYNSMRDNPSTGNEEYVTVQIVNEVTDGEGNIYEVVGENATRNGTSYIISSGLIYSVSGGVKDEVIGEVASVRTKTVTATADNRIYVYSGSRLDISSDEDLEKDKFGPVKGMTFFGIYVNDEETGNEFYTGMYEKGYTVGNSIQWKQRNYSRSYVQGLHQKSPEQDITVDGFYTVFEQFTRDYAIDENIDETNYEAVSIVNYITPTPEADSFYMWFAGPDADVYYYPLTLVASKYSTQGAYSLFLSEINFENATFEMRSVNSDLADGIELIDKSDILTINPNQTDADNKFALSMNTGNNAWSMNGETNFFVDSTTGDEYYEGTSTYKTENSKSIPSLEFYLTHSNNISIAAKEELGYYTITMRLTYYKDALTKAVATVIFDITLKTRVFEDVGYDASITPGRKYDIFAKNLTNISPKSSFSAYFELAGPESALQSTIRNFYTPGEEETTPTGYDIDSKVAAVNGDNFRELYTTYTFPEDTTITMIDKSVNNNPQYYYYTVTSADVMADKRVFALDEFLRMGSTNEHYDNSRRNLYKHTVSSGDYHYECFLFIVDFENAKFQNIDDVYDITNGSKSIGINLTSHIKNHNNSEIQITLLDDYIIKNSITFGIYNVNPIIAIDPTLSKNKIYLGNSTDLIIDTNYQLQTVGTVTNSATVYDTRYFDKKQGVKLTIYNEANEVVKGAALLGLYFEVLDPFGNITEYYPRTDGTTRIKVADRVSNSRSTVRIKTEKSTIPSGNYTIVIESFASADGVYYGTETSDSKDVELEIVNNMYGLDSVLPEEQVIIDKATGFTLENDTGYIEKDANELNLKVDYSSGFTQPYIAVSLLRRDYNNPYDRTYSYVDLQDYVTESLTRVPTELLPQYEYTDSSGGTAVQKNAGYVAFNTATIKAAAPNETVSARFNFDLTLKNNLKTGTYKIMFKLYDITERDIEEEVYNETTGDYDIVTTHVTEYELIGDTFSYIIIK